MALLRLPGELRDELKEPLGPVHTDPAELDPGDVLVAVGDIVTYHLERAGRTPDVSVVDDRSERAAVDEEIRTALGEADVVVENPAATITAALLEALRDALAADEPVRIRVDGEEDLATLPAIVAAPDGASVVYGQPGEGMVHVRVTPETRERARAFIERMDGDTERALSLLSAP